MQEKLVIFLHANELARPSWAVVDAQGLVRQRAYRDSAEGLAQIADDKEVILVVPAEEVLLLSVILPKMTRSRAMQALPFAIEDQLTADIESLHMVMGMYQAEKPIPIAVVAHDKMRQWLALLQSWQIEADVVLPLSLALPCDEGVWHAYLDDMAVVRTSLYEGFACDKQNLSELLVLHSKNQASLPEVLHMYCHDLYTPSSPMPCQIKMTVQTPEQTIEQLAANLHVLPALNLLQRPYAPRKRSRMPAMSKTRRAAIYLAAAWMLLLFLYPTVSYFILAQRVHEIDEQIEQIYRHHFPHSAHVIAPMLRMQEKLQQLNGQTGQNRLLILMAKVGQGLHEHAGIKLKRLDFQNNQLTLDLKAASSDDFSSFTDAVSRQGVSVKQQNATLDGAHINATLLLE